ncbi:hypothetical protein OG948_31795 [Embleya sp. NBC_00888]|uniref:hypothetical protein n=1 Tax=Embleya sp. NBC_00888 TaxID=2975960 RepID=UPI00386F03A4|nr:hypothetical protein OG948_31795 [Embleya sp. NBC_00888]
MPSGGSSRFDWRRMTLARRAASPGGPRPPKPGNGLVIGAVIIGAIVILAWWLLSSDGSDNGKKSASATALPNASGSGNPSASGSGTAVPSPTSTVKLAVIARQAIGLEIREKPGKGKTIAEVSAGTELTATCRAKGSNVYGWRGGKSDQWVLVTTGQGTGYAPEAWLETTGSAKDLLPVC